MNPIIIIPYILMAALACFTIATIGYRKKWDDDNIFILSAMGAIGWPFALPVAIICVVFTKIMQLAESFAKQTS